MVQAIQVLRFHLLELEKVRKTTTTTKFIPSTYCSILLLLLLLLLLVSPISSISSKYVNYVHVLPRLTDRHMMVTCAPPISSYFLRRNIHIHILLFLLLLLWVDKSVRWMQEMDASCFIAFLDFGSNHFMHLHFSLFIKSTTTTTFLPFPSVPFDGP